jgi:hypothetical protein
MRVPDVLNQRLGQLGYAPIRQNPAAVAQYPPFRSHSLR